MTRPASQGWLRRIPPLLVFMCGGVLPMLAAAFWVHSERVRDWSRYERVPAVVQKSWKGKSFKGRPLLMASVCFRDPRLGCADISDGGDPVAWGGLYPAGTPVELWMPGRAAAAAKFQLPPRPQPWLALCAFGAIGFVIGLGLVLALGHGHPRPGRLRR